MPRDMTKGNPFRQIIAFWIPLMIGIIFQQFYNMADSIIVGKFVGVDALAGVGSTGAVNFLILGFANGLCSGFSVMYGQCFGAGDYKRMRSYIANAIRLAAVIALILTPAAVYFCRDFLIFMDTPREILDEAFGYISVIFAGIPVLMMYNCGAAILRSIGDSKTPVYALVASAGINIILDLVFVAVLHTGVWGAAAATVIAQGISGGVCFFYMLRKYDILRFTREDWKWDAPKTRRLLSTGVPMALQYSITAAGSVILQTAANGLGADCVAAMSAGSRIQGVFSGAMEAAGVTMASFCSQNMGAGKYGRIRKGIADGIILEILLSGAGFVLLNLLGTPLALLFVDASEAEVIRLIRVYLKVTTSSYALLGVLYVLRSGIQGMGYGVLPMCAGLFELAGRIFAAFFLVKPLGFIGVTLANPAAWLAADLLLVGVYLYIRRKVLFPLKTERIPEQKICKRNKIRRKRE